MQCWDGYAEYCQWQGIPYANCTTTGYVRDIWDNRHTNGTLNHFVEVERLQPGDVVVFSVNGSTPLSHIAIFDSDAGGGYGYFLGQNQGGVPNPQGGSNFNITKLPYSATYRTAFRPKKFINTTQKCNNLIILCSWIIPRKRCIKKFSRLGIMLWLRRINTIPVS